MTAAVSPAKVSRAEQLARLTLAAVARHPGIELAQLHAQLGTGPVLGTRDALETLHRRGEIYSERTSTGRLQYFPRRGKPLAAAVELARATPEQLTGKELPQAKSGSAAPGVQAAPPSGGGAAPMPPAASHNAAEDFAEGSVSDAPMVVRAGGVVCRAYQYMAKYSGPITAADLASQLKVTTPAAAVAASMLTARGVLAYRPGSNKRIAGTYSLAASPRPVRILDACMSGRFVLPAPPRAPSLQEKQDLLQRLKTLVTPQEAEILGAISQDLTGVSA